MTAIFPSALATDDTLGVPKNGAQTQLNGSLNNSDTTITVDDTTAFATESGIIVIDSEVIIYTSKNATQFLGCTRAFDGSSAATHSDNAVVYGYIVAHHIRQLQEDLIAVETILGTTAQDVDLTGKTAGLGIKFKGANGSTYRLFVDADGSLAVEAL